MSNLDSRFPKYLRLLRLFPENYRNEYEHQMLQTLADMLDDPESNNASIWARTVLDFPVSVVREQLIDIGGVMTQQMPHFVKQNAVIGACMLAPFFVFIILNNLTNQRLHNSFVWHTNALYVWLVLLPSLALILNVVALLRWTYSRRKNTQSSMWRPLTNFKTNWPAVVVITLSFGILALVFGHDTVQCFRRSPVWAFSHHSQTVQCVQKNY